MERDTLYKAAFLAHGHNVYGNKRVAPRASRSMLSIQDLCVNYPAGGGAGLTSTTGTHSLTYSPTHSLIYSPTHSPNHLLTMQAVAGITRLTGCTSIS